MDHNPSKKKTKKLK